MAGNALAVWLTTLLWGGGRDQVIPFSLVLKPHFLSLQFSQLIFYPQNESGSGACNPWDVFVVAFDCFLVLGMEPRALCMLGKHSTT
jgi:hypothetical protein